MLPDGRLERLYSSWSEGGYGLVITGNVMVDRRQLGEPGNVVIEDERDLDALSRWAKATKDGGVPIWVQLNHPGRQSNPLAVGHTPVAPSAGCAEPAGFADAPCTHGCGDRGHHRAVRDGGRGVWSRRVSTACRSTARTVIWWHSSCHRCPIERDDDWGGDPRAADALSGGDRAAHPVSRLAVASPWASS